MGHVSDIMIMEMELCVSMRWALNICFAVLGVCNLKMRLTYFQPRELILIGKLKESVTECIPYNFYYYFSFYYEGNNQTITKTDYI